MANTVQSGPIQRLTLTASPATVDSGPVLRLTLTASPAKLNSGPVMRMTLVGTVAQGGNLRRNVMIGTF